MKIQRIVEKNPWTRNMVEGKITKLEHAYKWSKRDQDVDRGDAGGIKGKNLSITINIW